MREVKGDIWDYYDKGNWIVITTNGTVKSNGEAVMGRGIALEAKQRDPKLPKLLGNSIKESGNIPHFFINIESNRYIISLPVKHKWFEKADKVLIEEGIRALSQWAERSDIEPIYMVRPGCGNGKLDWKDVKPILERYLDDRFIIVKKGV